MAMSFDETKTIIVTDREGNTQTVKDVQIVGCDITKDAGKTGKAVVYFRQYVGKQPNIFRRIWNWFVVHYWHGSDIVDMDKGGLPDITEYSPMPKNVKPPKQECNNGNNDRTD